MVRNCKEIKDFRQDYTLGSFSAVFYEREILNCILSAFDSAREVYFMLKEALLQVVPAHNVYCNLMIHQKALYDIFMKNP